MYSPAVILNVNESVMCIICGLFVLVLYTGIKSVLEPNQPTLSVHITHPGLYWFILYIDLH